MNPEGRMKVLVLGDEPRVAARDESGSCTVVLYGSPAIGSRTAFDSGELDQFASNPVQAVRQLDGEFGVFIETADRIVIASDRFASHPVFYLVEDSNLVISFSYSKIWRWLSDNNLLKVDPLAFYEFLHFQRLFGTTTFDQSSSTLPPATVLTFDKATGELKLERYWSPDFSKRHDGRKAIARDLADAVQSSVAQKTADATNVSLLLSGGMDSRVILGGFGNDNLPLCLTVGDSENNEVDVARSLAGLVGAKHAFVPRTPTHYANILPESTATGGGMYLFQHGHFFGLDIPATDLVLHGHGFDYMFQGMYLPSRRKRFLGRPTRSWALDPIGFDLVGQYIDEAKYRLKGIDPTSLLKPGLATDANERLRTDLEAVLKPVQGETAEAFDEWDYLTTSAPGRHYTYLNLLSAASLAEQRTVAFDNDTFDIYYSTPANVRHGTMLLAETIKNLNPQLLEVRNANTNLRPDLSPLKLTIGGWTRSARRRIGLGGAKAADPSQDDRSWLTGDSLLRGSEPLQGRINGLGHSARLEGLGIFDLSQVGNALDAFRSGNKSVAPALLTLLTIDTFLGGSG